MQNIRPTSHVVILNFSILLNPQFHELANRHKTTFCKWLKWHIIMMIELNCKFEILMIILETSFFYVQTSQFNCDGIYFKIIPWQHRHHHQQHHRVVKNLKNSIYSLNYDFSCVWINIMVDRVFFFIIFLVHFFCKIPFESSNFVVVLRGSSSCMFCMLPFNSLWFGKKINSLIISFQSKRESYFIIFLTLDVQPSF